jgi:NAD-dependent dihydropyrimidine dehydrogenase PreA subunit
MPERLARRAVRCRTVMPATIPAKAILIEISVGRTKNENREAPAALGGSMPAMTEVGMRLGEAGTVSAVTYIIGETCIDVKDKSCVDVCAVDCIHEAKRILVIDPEECIDCGACEPECPVDAPLRDDRPAGYGPRQGMGAPTVLGQIAAIVDKHEPCGFSGISSATQAGRSSRRTTRRTSRPDTRAIRGRTRTR